MVYIPEDLLIDTNNMDKVHELLAILNVDLVEKDRTIEVVNELKDLGETKIIEKLNDGFFNLGA